MRQLSIQSITGSLILDIYRVALLAPLLGQYLDLRVLFPAIKARGLPVQSHVAPLLADCLGLVLAQAHILAERNELVGELPEIGSFGVLNI